MRRERPIPFMLWPYTFVFIDAKHGNEPKRINVADVTYWLERIGKDKMGSISIRLHETEKEPHI